MRYKAVIFDLDGVICSTDEYHYRAWKSIADELGIPFDRSVNEKLRGVSRMESLNIILSQCGNTMDESGKLRCVEKKNDLYREMLKKMSPDDLDGETARTLQILRAQGLKLAIGSSSKNTGFILQQIGLGDFFDAVSDGNNISHSKPDPEVFLKAADMLQTAYADCLVVEDAEAGIQAAERAGMDSAAIGYAANAKLGMYQLTRFSDLLETVNEQVAK